MALPVAGERYGTDGATGEEGYRAGAGCRIVEGEYGAKALCSDADTLCATSNGSIDSDFFVFLQIHVIVVVVLHPYVALHPQIAVAPNATAVGVAGVARDVNRAT